MNLTLTEITHELKSKLKKSVENNIGEGILLSGGLDTSIVSKIASDITDLYAITVAFKGHSAIDIQFAKLMAKELQIKHEIYYFEEEELFSAIQKTISIMKSFDPMEIRNSATIYIALNAIKQKSIKNIMTGDGADELFGGYSFFFNKTDEELELELKRISEIMTFSSVPLANSLGLEAKIPFMDPDIIEFALSIPAKYKIVELQGKKWGKWILRKAFEDELPKEIIWRDKAPIEVGSGTTILPKLFDEKILKFEFKEKKNRYLTKDNVTIRDKEHLYYYEIFRNLFGAPKTLDSNLKICPYCNTNVKDKATFCTTCGAYPI